MIKVLNKDLRRLLPKMEIELVSNFSVNSHLIKREPSKMDFRAHNDVMQLTERDGNGPGGLQINKYHS